MTKKYYALFKKVPLTKTMEAKPMGDRPKVTLGLHSSSNGPVKNNTMNTGGSLLIQRIYSVSISKPPRYFGYSYTVG